MGCRVAFAAVATLVDVSTSAAAPAGGDWQAPEERCVFAIHHVCRATAGNPSALPNWTTKPSGAVRTIPTPLFVFATWSDCRCPRGWPGHRRSGKARRSVPRTWKTKSAGVTPLNALSLGVS